MQSRSTVNDLLAAMPNAEIDRVAGEIAHRILITVSIAELHRTATRHRGGWRWPHR
jgi:hypothetical protein